MCIRDRPIPPLDGSRVVRNLLPYNAVQVYDRIPIWVSYLLMIFVGGAIMGALLRPSLRLCLLYTSFSRVFSHSHDPEEFEKVTLVPTVIGPRARIASHAIVLAGHHVAEGEAVGTFPASGL